MRRITFSLVVCACLVLVAGTEAGTGTVEPSVAVASETPLVSPPPPLPASASLSVLEAVELAPSPTSIALASPTESPPHEEPSSEPSARTPPPPSGDGEAAQTTSTSIAPDSESPSQSSSTSESPSNSSSHTTDEALTPTPSSDAPFAPPPPPSASAAPTLETDKDADPLDFPLFHAYRAKIEAALPDPSARRSKKAAQRARHEAAAASSSDDHRDPLELPLLNIDDPTAQLFPERVTTEDTLVQRDLIPAAPRRDHHSTSARDPTAHTDSRMQDPSTPHPDSEESTSPIQPLPDVGTGLATDPLLALKDRYNYALFGCAATVHRSSPQTKGATSILVEKKDQYMLTPCSVERKFVELELCDAVRIDTVVLANFEFFSSMFKKFRITASKNYPGRQDEWIDLGTFRARNIRGVQVFHPKATGASAGFFRYLRLDFLSHYGSEFYCPVSLLRVYGLTEILAWREQEKQMQLDEALAAAEDDEDELELEDASAGIADDGFAGVWSDGLDKMTGNSSANVVNATIPTEGEVKSDLGAVVEVEEVVHSSVLSSGSAVAAPTEIDAETSSPSSAVPLSTSFSSDVPSPSPTSIPSSSEPTQTTSDTAPPTPTDAPPISTPTLAPTDASPLPDFSRSQTQTSIPASELHSTTVADPLYETTAQTQTQTPPPPPPPASIPSDAPPSPPSPSDTPFSTTTTTTTTTSTSTTVLPPRPIVPRNETRVVLPPLQAQPQQVQPGESIYGTIMKRLSSLEHNQSLSMHYIEAQGVMLRDAFGRVEKRLGEVEQSRSSNDVLIRQALQDLEKHHAEVNRDRAALTSQVNLLTNELLLEKRLGVAQLCGLLALFVFVGMTRGSPTTPFLHLAHKTQSRQQQQQQHHSRPPGATSRSGAEEGEQRRREESRRDDNRSESSGEVYRKHQRTSSMAARPLPAKRVANSGVNGPPRRHYSQGGTARRPQSWTPPHHPRVAPLAASTSFTPDDAFLASLSSAFDRRPAKSNSNSPSAASSTPNKRSSNPRPTSPLAGRPMALFPHPDQHPPFLSDSPDLTPAERFPVAHDLSSSSRPPHSDSSAFASSSSSSSNDDADPFSTGADTDERGYRTLSEDDELAGMPPSHISPVQVPRKSWIGRLVRKPPAKRHDKLKRSASENDRMVEQASPRPLVRLPEAPPEPEVVREVEGKTDPARGGAGVDGEGPPSM